MSAANKNSTIQSLAENFVILDARRQQLERTVRQLKKHLDTIKETLQETIGTAKELDVPYVSVVGDYQICQILKHRDVEAHSYDFVDFKVVKK